MLDCLPHNVPVRVVEGATARVLLLLRDALDAPVVQAGLSNVAPAYAFDRRIYDEGGQSPETPIPGATLLNQLRTADNSVDATDMCLAALTVNGESPQPAGHTFRDLFDPSALFDGVAGKTYTIEYTFRLASSGGVIVHRVPLVIESAYN